MIYYSDNFDDDSLPVYQIKDGMKRTVYRSKKLIFNSQLYGSSKHIEFPDEFIAPDCSLQLGTSSKTSMSLPAKKLVVKDLSFTTLRGHTAATFDVAPTAVARFPEYLEILGDSSRKIDLTGQRYAPHNPDAKVKHSTPPNVTLIIRGSQVTCNVRDFHVDNLTIQLDAREERNSRGELVHRGHLNIHDSRIKHIKQVGAAASIFLIDSYADKFSDLNICRLNVVSHYIGGRDPEDRNRLLVLAGKVSRQLSLESVTVDISQLDVSGCTECSLGNVKGVKLHITPES